MSDLSNDMQATIDELEAKNDLYKQTLQSIAEEEQTLGWIYAARMAKATLLEAGDE